MVIYVVMNEFNDCLAAFHNEELANDYAERVRNTYAGTYSVHEVLMR